MKTPGRDRQAEPGAEKGEQVELFERNLTASYPNPNSQAGCTLRDLLAGKHLRQSERLTRGWRLAAEVKELKYLGWPVLSLPVHVEGRNRPIAQYSLPAWVLREVGAANG